MLSRLYERFFNCFGFLLVLMLALTLTPRAQAQTSFAVTTTGVQWSGPCNDATGVLVYRQLSAALGRTDFTFTGTALSIKGYTTAANPITLTVDGAVSSPTFATLNAVTTQSVISGLTDAAHKCTIQYNGTGTIYFERSDAFMVTGSTPAISSAYPQGMAAAGDGNAVDFGPQYLLSASVTDPVLRTNISSNILVEGGWSNPTALGSLPFPYQGTWPDQAISSIRATTSELWAYVYYVPTGQTPAKLQLIQDGVPLGQVTLPTTSVSGGGDSWVLLAKNLDSAHEHEYRIQNVYLGQTLLIWAVMTPGGTVNTTFTPTARPYWAFYGDSRVRDEVGTYNNTNLGWVSQVGLRNNVAVYNRGISSSTVLNATGLPGSNGAAYVTTQSGQARTTDITSLSPAPSKVFIEYEVNDYQNNPGLTTPETPAQFQAACQAMLTSLTTGLPAGTPMFYMLEPVRPAATLTQLIPWQAALMAAIAAVGNPNIHAVDLCFGINFTSGLDSDDGLHENGRGNFKQALNTQTLLLNSFITGAQVKRGR